MQSSDENTSGDQATKYQQLPGETLTEWVRRISKDWTPEQKRQFKWTVVVPEKGKNMTNDTESSFQHRPILDLLNLGIEAANSKEGSEPLLTKPEGLKKYLTEREALSSKVDPLNQKPRQKP